MSKRSVDIDDEALKEAKELLGTSTVDETVNRALEEVVRIKLQLRHLVRLARHEGLDLHDPEVMAGAWRCSPDT